jgi:hypothetical protein
MALLPGRQRDDGARFAGIDGHRLFDQHVQPALQRGQRLRPMQAVRRGDDQRIHRHFGQQLLERFRAVRDAELLLHLAQFGRAKTADADQLDIVAGFEDRQMIGGGPPADTDDAHANLALSHNNPPILP